MSALGQLILLVVIALIFDFFNGFHDSANIVATMIASRAMSAKAALTLVAIAEFAGPFILGVAVAKTVGTEVASPQALTIAVVIAALLSASLWNIVTWYFGVPSSSSHALIGGILGAVALGSGLSAIRLEGVWKIALALFVSPVVGFLAGLVIMYLTLILVQSATPKANIFFNRAQIPTAIALALSHGGNDAQKTMGIITLGLLILGFQENFSVPWWVILLSAAAIAAGTATGGWRIIHTLGGKFYRIRPIHSLTSQLTSGLVVLTASLLGGPVSTTQVVSSSILGVGAAQRKSQVRWGVMTDILAAWVLTVPAAAVIAALLYFPIKFLVE
ncbi:MAG TPA: anion permease [Anaerolineae bacterium]|nr:anion permease [Anaerolineae bacterium]HXW01701.1 anion permease [Anaerolineae bacterium]